MIVAQITLSMAVVMSIFYLEVRLLHQMEG